MDEFQIVAVFTVIFLVITQCIAVNIARNKLDRTFFVIIFSLGIIGVSLVGIADFI